MVSRQARSPTAGLDAQFLPDGHVAVAGDGDLVVIDPRSTKVTKRYVLGANAVRFAIDSTGRLLATVGANGGVQLWDARRLAPIGAPLKLLGVDDPRPMRFSDDGHYLVISGPSSTTWVDTWTAEWPQVACSLVTDPLSSTERNRYLGSPTGALPCE